MTVLAERTVDAGRPAGAGTPPSMVERMTLILDAFPSPGARLSLEQVARAAHLPRSTAHRILEQLLRLEWVEHSASGYALGSRALALGGRATGHEDLRAAAADQLHRLHVRTGLVVHLAVLEGADVRYLDKIGGPRATTVPSRVGGRLPAYRTALGRALLAWSEPEEVDAVIGPELAAGELDRLHQDLHRVRARRGLAFEHGGMADDIACVALAVRPAGSLGPASAPVGAISLVGDADTPLTRVAPLLVDAARAVTERLWPHD
ncbi:IclR family transcriptional regulator [Nocardioides sp. SYSU DS0663]|uniref:IclR family transcriptional regulator n=1 Tax=Nocardioides sp. SYSU DS0663 TaxID=3416445 RepID=UPI003F4C5B73